MIATKLGWDIDPMPGRAAVGARRPEGFLSGRISDDSTCGDDDLRRLFHP